MIPPLTASGTAHRRHSARLISKVLLLENTINYCFSNLKRHTSRIYKPFPCIHISKNTSPHPHILPHPCTAHLRRSMFSQLHFNFQPHIVYWAWATQVHRKQQGDKIGTSSKISSAQRVQFLCYAYCLCNSTRFMELHAT